MANIGSHVISIISSVSVVCLLVGMILLLNLIQRAFASAGIIWGLVSIAYPPGTYFYCRRNWEQNRSRFLLISWLFVVALVLGAISRFAT